MRVDEPAEAVLWLWLCASAPNLEFAFAVYVGSYFGTVGVEGAAAGFAAGLVSNRLLATYPYGDGLGSSAAAGSSAGGAGVDGLTYGFPPPTPGVEADASEPAS